MFDEKHMRGGIAISLMWNMRCITFLTDCILFNEKSVLVYRKGVHKIIINFGIQLMLQQKQLFLAKDKHKP